MGTIQRTHTEATALGPAFYSVFCFTAFKDVWVLRAGSRAGSSVILCLSSHVSLVSLSGQVFINWVLVYKLMGWGGKGGEGPQHETNLFRVSPPSRS